jgi:hypothetical protein
MLPDPIMADIAAGRLIPYLGPGVPARGAPLVPTSEAALAAFLGARVALPRRARGNPWAAAQFIEGQRHRKGLEALMAEAYAKPVPPLPLHHMLACLAPPLIVDTWYDGAMRSALAARGSAWGEIQGITRAGIGEARWYRAYDASGREVEPAVASDWPTLLYKPHGAVTPAHNFLVADSDYVEVLTEIDIQTPIPDAVKQRREGRGFLFIGCRFHDQLLRTYARQVMKRSAGPHFALLAGDLTRNERGFLEREGITPLGLDVAALEPA